MRSLIILIGVLISSLGLSAQTRLTVETPRVTLAGEPFRVVFTVNAVATGFTAPSFDGLSVLAGPTPSTVDFEQIINGKRSRSVSYSYTYVLESSKEGKSTIGSALVTTDAGAFKSDPVTIEFVKGELPADNQSRSNSQQVAGVKDQDLFLRLHLSKNRVVKGEPLVATWKLYSRVQVVDITEVHFPTFNGFWSQEVAQQQIEFQGEESVNGKIYRTAVLKQHVLLPQQTGSLKIEPSDLVCIVRVTTGGGGKSLLDNFFDSYQDIRKRLGAPAQTIQVESLPAGAPASFTGAVGKFSLSASLSRDSINAHEAMSLVVKISGQGNVNLVETPKLNFPADFEVYDTKVTDNSKGAGGSVSGVKEFEYPIIPRSAGTFTLEPVAFSYWDLSQKKYVTLSSGPLTIRVGKGTGNSGQSAVYESGVSQMAVKNIGEDIRYIHTALPVFTPVAALFMGSILFWAIVTAIIVCFFVAYRLLLRRRERNKNVLLVRNRKANKQAKLRLQKANTLLKQNIYSGFYEEVHRALWGYTGDKLGIPPAEHAKDKVSTIMLERKASETAVKEFLDLAEACEFARYAPAPEPGAMDKIYERALTLISNLEQSLK